MTENGIKHVIALRSVNPCTSFERDAISFWKTPNSGSSLNKFIKNERLLTENNFKNFNLFSWLCWIFLDYGGEKSDQWLDVSTSFPELWDEKRLVEIEIRRRTATLHLEQKRHDLEDVRNDLAHVLFEHLEKDRKQRLLEAGDGGRLLRKRFTQLVPQIGCEN